MDINKLIMAEHMAPCDAIDWTLDIAPWSEESARTAARAEAIEMDDRHMEVLCFLRDQHSECGPAKNARSLLRTMEESFASEGGLRYLYRLFPHGPVTQGCRLAGIPVPAGNADASFGTVH